MIRQVAARGKLRSETLGSLRYIDKSNSVSRDMLSDSSDDEMSRIDS